MARKIAQRIHIKGELLTESPLHVGGVSLDPTIDLSLAVDGRGCFYIPGTSLAGALRSYLDRNDLWGYQEETRGHASHIVIDDTFLSDESVVFTEVRDGVQIDRRWGTAADKGKFDRAIIPKGVRLSFKMSLDLPRQEDSSQPETYASSLDRIIGALIAGEIRLGAAKTRGLGRVKLENCQRLVHIFQTKAGILAALQNSPVNSAFYEEYNPPKVIVSDQIKVTINWKPVGAVMVKDSIEGNAVDVLPLTSANGEALALVIPGSSVKGAMRFQAERILRTLCPNLTSSDDFKQQVQVPIVQSLFGAAAQKGNKEFGQGAMFIEDCYSQQQSSRKAWQQVVQADKDSNLIAVLSNANLPTVQQAFHVAVDRWTGGAAEHMLYSNLELFGINWSPIELQVNLARLGITADRLTGIALLLLLLRDLCQQRIPLGYGVNRGLGAISVQSIRISGSGLPLDSPSFSWSIDPHGSFEGIDPELLASLDEAWYSAINQHQSTAGATL
jgi:CRISPR/Cas system CSM-associated protein Csm3 (group 7 of RAMP superfamily)